MITFDISLCSYYAVKDNMKIIVQVFMTSLEIDIFKGEKLKGRNPSNSNNSLFSIKNFSQLLNF